MHDSFRGFFFPVAAKEGIETSARTEKLKPLVDLERLNHQEVAIMKLKTPMFLAIILVMTLLMNACETQETPQPALEAVVLEARVLEVIGQDQLLVEPVAGSPELGSADRIVAHTNDSVVYDESGEETTIDTYEVGRLIHITYDGRVAESYPAQVWAQQVQLVE